MKQTIAIVQHNECTGCGACYNVCPQNAISMVYDQEGFLFPLIEKEVCIQCGKCAQICPALCFEFQNAPQPECYAVWANDSIRAVSSSGGMFTLLADYVLERGGIVCGAAFSDNYDYVHHIIISNSQSLKKLRGSKYVQSDIGLIYRQILAALNRNQYVLFSGCPCQVAGLYAFLGQKFERLITCDIICHGANSPKAYQAFLSDREKKQGQICSVNFREKEVFGWSTPTTIHFTSGSVYRKHANQCTWYQGFLGGIINRAVCGHCKYATVPRVGDITLGDFWHIDLYNTSFDDKKGTSCVLVNSDLGQKIFEQVRERMTLCEKVPMSYAQEHNWQLRQPQKADLFRRYFFELVDSLGYDESIRRVREREFDVGVVAWWYNDNYGGVLTSFALHEVIKSFGLSVLMIDIPTISVDRKQADLPTMSRKFGRKHYYSSAFLQTMKAHNLHCHTFISGSDQMWSYALRQKTNNRTDYHLGFVYDYKKKISYASSFGATAQAPEEYNMLINLLLHKFDYISVREDYAVDLCKNTFGIDCVHVLDPVFLPDPEVYTQLANESSAQLVSTPYLCAYILDPTAEKKAAIRYVARKLKMELVVIGDPEPLQIKNKKKLEDLPGYIDSVELEDFVYYLKNASFIITDSYHGSCFSMLFRKNFISIGNRSRGVERFQSLFRQFPLSQRMLLDIEDIYHREDLFSPVDYNNFEEILAKERVRCRTWLKTALFTQKKYQALDFSVLENEIDRLDHRINALKTLHYQEKDKLAARVKALEECFKQLTCTTHNVTQAAKLTKKIKDYFKK